MSNRTRRIDRINFFTYADQNFKNAKERLVSQANRLKIFHTIKSYGPDDLDFDFLEKYKDILKNPKGGGFWIWRYHLIDKYFQKMKDGDILIYLDAGCHFNMKAKSRLYDYIKIVKDSKFGILSFQMENQLEKWWTVKEIFDYFNIKSDSEIGNTGQYLGGILFIKKCEHSINYIKKMLKILEENQNLFTDYYNDKNQEKYFKDNRHEQSVSSVLRKIMGSEVITKDETWFPNFDSEEAKKYPIWAKRDRN